MERQPEIEIMPPQEIQEFRESLDEDLKELELESMVYPLIAEEPKDRMHLYILGKSPAWQDKNGASSGYLVQTFADPKGELETHSTPRNILIDCGSGVVAQLQNYINPVDLDVVYISHLHADHYFDLVPLAYLLKYSPYPHGSAAPKDISVEVIGSNTLEEEFETLDRPRKPRLIVPPGAREVFRSLGALWGAPGVIEDSFSIEEHTGSLEKIHLDLEENVTLRIAPVPHLIETYALDVRAVNQDGSVSRFTYGADCGMNNSLIRLARNTPLLIAEATMPEDQDPGDDLNDSKAFHLSAHQAGQMAGLANAAEVVLTHFSERYDSNWMLSEVERSGYQGKIYLAVPGLVFSDNLIWRDQ